MRQSLKIAISLLASLLLFAGFAVVAFSGLFNVLQASFFLPRIERVYQSDLASLSAAIEHFHTANIEAYRGVARKDFVAASFFPNLSDATLKGWSDTTSQLGLFGVRLIGSDGRKNPVQQLPRSRREAANRARRRRTRTTTRTARTSPLETLLVPPRRTASGSDRRRPSAPSSTACRLRRLPRPGPCRRARSSSTSRSRTCSAQLAFSAGFPVDQVSLVGTAGVLINGPAGSKTVTDALLSIWAAKRVCHRVRGAAFPDAPDGTSAGYRVFSQRLALGGVASMLVANSRFEMTDLMKGLLLATFFFTVFLLLYLLLNLRSDPLEVLRQRVKRFQIQLITELVESPGGADWGKWRREMESRKDEITWQIQRGIGRVSRRKKPVIDEYMNKSWGEIIDLISRRVETPSPAVAAMDFSRLEALIQTALQNANFVLPAPHAAPAARGPRVEEISAAEVVEEPQEVAAAPAAKSRRPGLRAAAGRGADGRRDRRRRRDGGS